MALYKSVYYYYYYCSSHNQFRSPRVLVAEKSVSFSTTLTRPDQTKVGGLCRRPGSPTSHSSLHLDDDGGSRLRLRPVLQALPLRAATGSDAGCRHGRADEVVGGGREAGRFHGPGRRLHGVPLWRQSSRHD